MPFILVRYKNYWCRVQAMNWVIENNTCIVLKKSSIGTVGQGIVLDQNSAYLKTPSLYDKCFNGIGDFAMKWETLSSTFSDKIMFFYITGSYFYNPSEPGKKQPPYLKFYHYRQSLIWTVTMKSEFVTIHFQSIST